MNLSITNACNKGCRFCFAQNKNDTFVDVETVKSRIASMLSLGISVSVLGGEPTLHNDLPEILEHLCQRARGMLVTNLTVKDGPSMDAVRYFNLMGRLGLLVNCHFEEDLRFFKRVKGNLKSLDTDDYCLAVTIYRPGQFVEGLVRLVEELPRTRRIRLDAARPGYSGSPGVRLLGNAAVGNTIHGLVKRIRDIDDRINFFFDCQFPPCMFDTKEKFELIRSATPVPYSFPTCYSSGSPLDILVDGTIICGYPTLGDPAAPTSHIERDPETLAREIRALHQFLRDETKPEDRCEKCRYFERECFGLPRCSRYLDAKPKKR